jgi:hypothetical protein
MANVLRYFGGDADEAGANIYSKGVECGWVYSDAFGLAQGELDIRVGEGLLVGVEFTVVGGWTGPAW